MSTTLESSLVRIRTHDNVIVGAGFLITEKRVLTCAHVIAQALSIPQNTSEIPSQEVTLDFPLVAPHKILSAKVIEWLPVQPDGSGDIACLELLGKPPNSADPALLIAEDRLWGHPFRAFGFPAGYDDGVWASGVLRAKQANGWVQIEDIKQTGYFIEPGFSGTAIWDEEANGIVGMTIAAERQSEIRAAFVIPVSCILKLFPELARQTIPPCPYRGLFHFREQDAESFFGRKKYIEKLVEAVQKQPLVAVIGASGSGKSSVVYAGLFPELRHSLQKTPGVSQETPFSEGQEYSSLEGGQRGVFLSQKGQRWLIASFRPGDNPFQALSRVLIPFLYTDELDRISNMKKLPEQFRTGEIALQDVIKRILQKDGKAEKFLLFVDQFEEIYTFCREDVERRRFLDELLSILPISPSPHLPFSSLVLTMRADFLGKALSYRPFGDALQDATLLLSPMNREELRKTIEEPAQKLNVKIEEGLTDRILDAVGDEPGNLPLLEFALTKLWEKQKIPPGSLLPKGGKYRILTHAAYKEIGGVREALASYAESVYERLDADEQERAQRIFTQLVRPGEGTEDTRRFATRADVGEKNWKLVTKLADARLVVTNRSANFNLPDRSANFNLPEEIVEVVHEALLTGWQRLRGWIDANREFRTWQERLRLVMRQWLMNNKDEGALLRGAPLAEAEGWLEQRRNDLSQDEQHFIKAGQQNRDKEFAEREAQRQHELEMSKQLVEEQRQRADEQAKATKKLRSRLVFTLILAVIAVVAAVGAFYGFKQAIQKRNEALRTRSLFLADLARQQREAGNVTNAILLALEALSNDLAKSDVFEAKVQLYNAVARLRERYILEVHEDRVFHTAFSPDGQHVVTASQDETACVWDATSGKHVATLKGHEAEVVHAAFSPDGQRVATASRDRNARLWDATSGAPLTVLTGHQHIVRHVAFSPNGQRVVTASEDRTARVWDVTTGKQIVILKGHEAEVIHATFSPNGQHIATASWDGTARLWDATSGKPLAVLQGHEAEVYHAEFSPDSQHVVTASKDGTARVWNAISGKPLAVLQEHEAEVYHAEFSPDSQHVVTASLDGSARLWDVSRGTQLAVLKGHKDAVTHAAFSPDGQRVVTVSWDRTAQVWDIANGKPLVVLHGHEYMFVHAAFSPDGQRVVTASEDGTARLWDVTSDKQVLALSGHKDAVYCAAFSPDGQRVVTASRDGTARVWNTISGTQIAALRGHEGLVYHAAFSPNGQHVLTASGDDTARLWDATSGKQLAVLRGHEHMVRYAAFSSDGQYVVTVSDDKTARVWDATSGKYVAILQGHEAEVVYAAFSPDDQHVVTASWDRTARVWDATSGKQLAVLQGHEAEIHHAAFSPDGQHVVTASKDGTSRVWDATSGEYVAILQGHEDRVVRAVFSPNGQRVVTASWDHTARLWDATKGTQLAVLSGHKGLVSYATFSPDGQHVVTASGDCTARVWDATSGEPLTVLRGHEYMVVHATFSPNGQRVLTASDDKTARVWPFFPSTQDLIDYARETVPRKELTPEQRKQFFLE